MWLLFHFTCFVGTRLTKQTTFWVLTLTENGKQQDPEKSKYLLFCRYAYTTTPLPPSSCNISILTFVMISCHVHLPSKAIYRWQLCEKWSVRLSAFALCYWGALKLKSKSLPPCNHWKVWLLFVALKLTFQKSKAKCR